MTLKWDMVRKRMATRGPDGRFLHAYTGGESDQELQAMVVCFSQNGFSCQNRQECLLRSLSGLSYISLQNMIQKLNRETCLLILDAECSCRNLGNGKNCQML